MEHRPGALHGATAVFSDPSSILMRSYWTVQGAEPYGGAGPSLAFRWSTTGERPTGLLPGTAVRLGEHLMPSAGAPMNSPVTAAAHVGPILPAGDPRIV